MRKTPENKNLKVVYPCLATDNNNNLFLFILHDVCVEMSNGTLHYRTNINIRDFNILPNNEVISINNNNKFLTDDEMDDEWLD